MTTVRANLRAGLFLLLLLSLSTLIALPAAASDGDLDITFGIGGKVITPFGSYQSIGQSVAIQSNGKIVVGGISMLDASTGDFALARYNTDGTLDSSFGTGGKVTTSFGNSGRDTIWGVAIYKSGPYIGKIVAAGDTTAFGLNLFALARYNTDGSLDTTFGGGTGKVTTGFALPGNFNVTSQALSVALQSDDRIVLAGNTVKGYNGICQDCPANNGFNFALARYNADGSLDTTFGGTGKVITDIGGFSFGSGDSAYSVAIQSDGKIVAAGYGNPLASNNTDFALVRYNSNGTLDTSFDTDGKVTTNFGSTEDVGYSLAIQSDGKMVLAGQFGGYPSGDFALARYNTDGSLDTSFDSDGKVTTNFVSWDSGLSVAIQSDGKIVAAGQTISASFAIDFALARYNTNGSLDTSFDSDGKVTTDFGGGPDVGHSVAIQNDGKIVVAGHGGATHTDFAVARYASAAAQSTLTLVKLVTNNSGGTATAADWTLSASGPTPISGAGGVSNSTVSSGTYTLSESALPAGYAASAWVCTGTGSQSFDTITLEPGQSATCTITNDDIPAHLTLTKSVITNNGGAAVASDWTLSASGPTPISGAGSVSSDVNPGTYTLSESTGPSGYSGSAWACSAGTDLDGAHITLTIGQSATCIITNDDITAHLKLSKTVSNTHGGAAVAADFVLSAAGPSPISGAGGAESDVDAGTYTLSESTASGYQASAWICTGGSQSGNQLILAVGQTAGCSITNSDIAPKLVVIKQVINDSGGFKTAADFSITVTGANVQPSAFSGSATGTAVTLNAGSYTVKEVEDWRYDTTLSADCTGAIASGESKTCTITNDDKPSLAGRMTGGGSVLTIPANERVTHGMELRCSSAVTSQNLEINWGKGNRFHLDTVTRMWCGNDPAIVSNPPAAGFDTLSGAGTGSYNGVSGATITFAFTDAGEPGRNDTATITVKDQSGGIVLQVSGRLNNGNQQARNN